jgi:VWFA-related protein
MPNQRALPLTLAVCAALVASLVAPLTAQDAQKAPPPGQPSYDETVEVTLVTTTFYVVDGDGNPVTDLRAEEVEVWVGGEKLPLAHFDASPADEVPATAEAGAAPAPAPATAPPSTRHVFLFFDLAFSLPRGVQAAKRAATDLVAQLPPTDLLYLLTFHSQHGLEQEMGPVLAERRPELLERIAALEPNVERLRRREDLQPLASGKRAGGSARDAYLEAHTVDESIYMAEGASLAAALRNFAVFMRQLPGPKVLLQFTQGIDSDLYGGLGAGRSFQGLAQGVNRHGDLRSTFDPALRALAETGAMLVFVDPVVGFEPDDRVEIAVDAEARWINEAPTGGATLQAMSETSGGMVIRDSNLRTLGETLNGWLRARYELGVYLAGSRTGGPLAADIRVQRRGVRAWTAGWLQPPRKLQDLAPAERAFLAVQLATGASPAVALRNVSAGVIEALQGVPRSSLAGEQLQLRFEPDEWRPDMLLRGLELYSVVVAPGDPPRVARVEQRFFTPTPMRDAVETAVPVQPDLLWGLVAFDLTSGRIYLGRFPVPASG